MGIADRVKKQHIVSETLLFTYCSQTLGIPVHAKDMAAARKVIKTIWTRYPHVEGDYKMLSDIVDWASARKKRYQTLGQLFGSWHYAAQSGYLKELDLNVSIQEEINRELKHYLDLETNKEWRQRLRYAAGLGIESFEQTTKEWEKKRLPMLIKEKEN